MRDIRKLVGILCLLVGIGCFSFTLQEVVDYEMADREYEVLEDTVAEETETGFTVDWDALLAQNDDIIGWLCMGPDIHYPVVRGIDNRYYLRRGIDKEYNRNGALFLDCHNSGFSDDHAIIYGHHMKSGAMFGQLDLYQEAAYAKMYPIVTLYTPEKTITYRIFCAILTTDGSWAYQIIGDSDPDMKAYLEQCKKEALYWDATVNVSEEDSVLSLSTCVGRSGGTRRLVVQAVQIKE